MRHGSVSITTRIVLLGGLAATWAIALVVQRAGVEQTGYLDVPPWLLLFGIAQCAAAGAAAWFLAPGHRRPRVGAVAGVAMLGAIIAGYALLVVAYADRFNPEAGGETWFSLLLEAWFWIGVPIVVSAALGMGGWLVPAGIDRGRRSRLHSA
jgi:hypothetical protein